MTAGQPADRDQPEVLDPDEAMSRARPLPPPEDIEMDGLSPQEWAAFYEALAEQ